MSGSCPACASGPLEVFHRVEDVPVNSCLLLESRAEAIDFPRGRLELAVCHSCGFISNLAFDPRLTEYSARYEETQGFSPRFVAFGRQLAQSWVERYDLYGKHVLEVGCGKGEFLVWMMEAGAGSATGIDPGVHPERLDPEIADRVEWIPEFYDERWSHLPADAIVCRHTLEHISPVGEFLSMVRDNLGDRTDVVVLFELPDAVRVLEEVAFWDTYYEHCSYFTPGSLARLFQACGFEVVDQSMAFDDQYLLIEARPSGTSTVASRSTSPDDLDRIQAGVAHFRDGYDAMVSHWRDALGRVAERGAPAVVWGGGSKAVAFLAGLGAGDQIAGAVDINPHKQGRYIAGSGHRVLAPTELVTVGPELVIAMNPVYLEEIRQELDRLGLQQARLVSV